MAASRRKLNQNYINQVQPFKCICVLSSNGSLDAYPNNTQVNFTNNLPYEFQSKLLNDNKIYVRLRSICLNQDFDSLPFNLHTVPDDFHLIVMVNLNELEPTTSNSGYSQCLGRFNFHHDASQKNHQATHEFENTPFLPLRTNPLSRLSVTLTTILGDELTVKRGPPTLVTLELSNMDTTSQFSMTCFSHTPDLKDIFPNNELHSFKVLLPQTMNMSGWEVALQSVVFPPSLQSEMKAILMLEFDDVAGSRAAMVFNLNQYSTTNELLDEIDNQLTATRWSTFVTLAVHRDDKPTVQATQDRSRGRLVLVRRELDVMEDDPVIVVMNPAMYQILGEIEQEQDNFEENATYNYLLGSDEELSTISNPDINRVIKNPVVMLYSDLVEDSCVSNTVVPLLHIYPALPTRTNQQVTGGGMYEPTHLIYKRVKDHSFNTIEFQIRLTDGMFMDYGSIMDDAARANMWGSGNAGGMGINLIFRPIINATQMGGYVPVKL